MTKKKERSVKEITDSLVKQIEVKKLPVKSKPLSFDLKQLGKDCIAKRERDNISLKSIYATHGVGTSQMFSVEAGLNTPNANTLAKIIDWLGEPIEKYFVRK